MDYTIDAFVNKLLQEKGVAGLSDEVMNQLRSDLTERAGSIINAEILTHLPKDKLEEFEKKLDDGNDEEIQKFCQEHIANLDEVVAGALIKLQAIYLANTVA